MTLMVAFNFSVCCFAVPALRTERDRSHSTPFPSHCRQGSRSTSANTSLFMPSFPSISFPSVQCSGTSELTSLWGSAPSTPTHAGIFFLEVGRTDLLSLSIPGYSNSLELTSSVREPGNTTRQTAKVPFNSHATGPGVTIPWVAGTLRHPPW